MIKCIYHSVVASFLSYFSFVQGSRVWTEDAEVNLLSPTPRLSKVHTWTRTRRVHTSESADYSRGYARAGRTSWQVEIDPAIFFSHQEHEGKVLTNHNCSESPADSQCEHANLMYGPAWTCQRCEKHQTLAVSSSFYNMQIPWSAKPAVSHSMSCMHLVSITKT
jgi:hypothetical protein